MPLDDLSYDELESLITTSPSTARQSVHGDDVREEALEATKDPESPERPRHTDAGNGSPHLQRKGLLDLSGIDGHMALPLQPSAATQPPSQAERLDRHFSDSENSRSRHDSHQDPIPPPRLTSEDPVSEFDTLATHIETDLAIARTRFKALGCDFQTLENFRKTDVEARPTDEKDREWIRNVRTQLADPCIVRRHGGGRRAREVENGELRSAQPGPHTRCDRGDRGGPVGYLEPTWVREGVDFYNHVYKPAYGLYLNVEGWLQRDLMELPVRRRIAALKESTLAV